MIGLMTISNSVTGQEVGRIVDGNPVFTVEKGPLLSSFTKSMKGQLSEDVIFVDAELVVTEDGSYIAFYDEPRTIRSAFSLEVDGNQIQAATGGGGTTCTTTCCASSSTECVPRNIFHGCTPCSCGDCRRSTSSGYARLELVALPPSTNK